MTKYIREIFLYLPMSYNQHKRNRQDFSSNENNNDYTHNKHYKNSSYNNYYYYQRNKYGRKYEFQEESKLNYKNGYLQENYGDISGDDYITYEDYSLLIKEIEKLKNDNKNLKESKEKFEKEIQKLKNNLKEKKRIDKNNKDSNNLFKKYIDQLILEKNKK